MEAVLGNRQFYANFGKLSVEEARDLFCNYYNREPEIVTVLNGRTTAGPVTKEEVKQLIVGGEQ